MSNIPISSLPIAVSLDGSEIVPIVQGGTTKRTTIGAISTFPVSDVSFVVATDSPGLSGSRRLFGETGVVTVTDNGPLSTIVIGINPDYPVTLYPPTFVNGVTNYDVLGSDTYLICNTASGALTINLQALSQRTRPLYVTCVNASTNHVTLMPNGSDLIVGQSSISLSDDFQSFWLYPFSTTSWLL